MTTFIPTPATQTDETIINQLFYPNISLNDLRASVRMDQVIENSQLEFSVSQALIIINDKLAVWKEEQIALGYSTIESIPGNDYGLSRKIILYYQAVYQQTKYDLLQQYRDYDSSHQGHENADAMSGRLDYCLLQVDAAITALIGTKPTRVVLI